MSESRKTGFYEKYIKRLLDIICAVLILIAFWWLYAIVAFLVRVKLGNPVIFKQLRPGKDEKIFYMYKFRTMTDERDDNGQLLADDVRLTDFGRRLRSTSLDELPEVFSIIKGDMSFVGPRPLLVKDMVFMSDEHRKRHMIRPGLSGLAQVHGRNNIDWNDKLDYDIEYMRHITFWGDVKILFLTVLKVLKREGITEAGKETAADYGDYLLAKGYIDKNIYEKKHEEADAICKCLCED